MHHSGKIIGSKISDNIHADGGKNIVHGRTGNDDVPSGPKSDILYGDAGNDYIVGRHGDIGRADFDWNED